MAKKITPYMIKKGLRYLKHFGLKAFLVRLQERMEPEEVPYGPWYESNKPTEKELEKQRKHVFSNSAKISVIVPAYRTPELFLCQMIETLLDQTYPNWELCIANASPDDEVMQRILMEYVQKDTRIKVKDLEVNAGISENTNEALAMATGDFIGLLDHDDILAPNALYEVALALDLDDQIDVIYSDEDKIRGEHNEHFQPHFKPDFNLDLLRSNNYICHFFVARRSLVEKVGGFRPEFNGAQDYDFIFRCTDEARRVYHIPEILYHWRTHEASTADNPMSKMYAYEAGKKAIEEHLKRHGQSAEVALKKNLGFYRVTYPVMGSPLVSIIIPNKDQKDSLELCLDSIQKKTTYSNYEIIIVENNSTTTEIFDYYKELEKDDRIRVITWDREFNYSAINNFGVQHAKGDLILFLNNDVEVLSENWMEELIANTQRPEVGITGVRLLYPDGTVQHGGTVIGIGGIAGHMLVGLPKERSGYMNKAVTQMNYSAVTAACMMMKRSVFDKIGGFEEKLAVAFNDVDLCLRTVAEGYLVVYNPYVELCHYESKSRGAEDSEEKVRRFQNEIEFMRTRWENLLKTGDPYYNKNLSLSKWNYSLRTK